ncbi:hypothetical protein MFRU_002g03580 [Monilinia fructicola]|uniref:Uncharacterized protein n=1 Tax=Monilinia fructicola TaxID=38448 RepID=A0A5M9K270_MONFR|nr:hypothetical protein EYC84_004232 [Monilinia fructicola]KAG4035009.1 hypothetical protein MFRU_002g03580 [Monilinia fructicola]
MADSLSNDGMNESSVGDGPLLLTLLMGNNNNNHAAQAAQAIADTLNPNYFALELVPPQIDIEEELDSDPSVVNNDGDDEPLLLSLQLANQNNNRKGAISNNDINESSIGDGPLLLTLVMGNNNNNQVAQAAQAIADTLNPNYVALELVPPQIDIGEELDSDPSIVNNDGDDGPLLLGLQLANQNNNRSARAISGGAIPDTLDHRGINLQLLPSQSSSENANDISFLNTDTKDYRLIPSTNGEDGSLLMTLPLNNQNQNQEAAADYSISDTLDPAHAAPEFYLPANDVEEINGRHGPLNSLLYPPENDYTPGDTITESIPDVLEMKSQLLELHSHGNLITETVPVVFKWKSQILQGRLVPATENTKNGVENVTHVKLDKVSIIKDATSKSRSAFAKPFVAPNEANKGRLSDEQLQFWKDNGYLIIPNALSTVQKDLLLKNVHDAAGTLARGGERVQKHSYLPGQESYVHPSGRAIATLTEYAFKPDIEPLKRIQRLGCGIHRVIPAFRNAILTPFHSELAKSLGYEDPRIIQSLIIVKAAEVGARVVPHQDGCSGFTDPPSCTTFWYALEDCTTENGCLAVAPGSHRTQPITRRCRMDKDGRPEFFNLDRPVFAELEGVSDAAPSGKGESGEFQYKKLEVEAGSLVLMHGNLMHTSEANHSSKSRVAFNFNVVEGKLAWLADNYLQPYEGETEFEKLIGT